MVLKGLAAAGLRLTRHVVGERCHLARAGASWCSRRRCAERDLAGQRCRIDNAFVQGVQTAVSGQAAAQWSGQRQGLDAATFQRLNALSHDDTPPGWWVWWTTPAPHWRWTWRAPPVAACCKPNTTLCWAVARWPSSGRTTGPHLASGKTAELGNAAMWVAPPTFLRAVIEPEPIL